MRNQHLLLLLALLLSVPAWAVPFTVGKEQEGQSVQTYGPPTRFMQDFERAWEAQKHPAEKAENAIPQRPITKNTYLGWCERSGHIERDLKRHGDGPYGPRHALPTLAKYAATGDKLYGESVKEHMRSFGRWLKTSVDAEGMNYQYMHEPTLIGLELSYLRKGGLVTAEDEVWIKEMILRLNRTVHVWGTPESFYRGPMHRAQGEGVMKWLAAQWYPDAPEAAQWRAYAKDVWNDWWPYRDNPPNDTGYYFGILFPIVLGVTQMERTPSGQTPQEFFNDPAMKKIWERLMYTVSPDGAVIPYGAHYGWNSSAGQRIWTLETIAHYTGDGRYRFTAHRMMNYFLYQEDRYRYQHMLDGPETTEQMGLAYVMADDAIKPVQPDAASMVLTHKETLRVDDKRGAAAYLKNLDPAPDKAHICCNLIVTDRETPFKLVFRSGWNPGDLFMLVDLFPRHEPMNPTGILGLTRYGAAFTQNITSKALTDTQNMLFVEDLSGMATPVINPNKNTVDAFYQEVSVDPFSDHKYGTHAVVHVKDYTGFPMTVHREFFFLKNRFVVVKDIAEFRESFLAHLGPTWNTQNVSAVGEHWANTYLTAPVAGPDVFLRQRPYDLLVYYASKPDARLTIDGDGTARGFGYMPFHLRYTRQGMVEAGKPIHFTQVLLPHSPQASAQKLVEGITVFTDTPEQTVLRVTDAKREEWVVLNAAGTVVKADTLETDAQRLYLDVQDGKVLRTLALGATYLTLGGKEIFRQPERKDWEK
ncbi:MAG: hypothetical protein ACYDBB_23220 [Armatimonadota bacterium]